jgi:hypothetical protein
MVCALDAPSRFLVSRGTKIRCFGNKEKGHLHLERELGGSVQ